MHIAHFQPKPECHYFVKGERGDNIHINPKHYITHIGYKYKCCSSFGIYLIKTPEHITYVILNGVSRCLSLPS